MRFYEVARADEMAPYQTARWQNDCPSTIPEPGLSAQPLQHKESGVSDSGVGGRAAPTSSARTPTLMVNTPQ